MREMGDFAVFTEEVAMGLLARGFKLRGYNNTAWFFEDSVLLEKTITELLEMLENK